MYRLVFLSDLMDLLGRGDDGEDSLFAQDTSLSRQPAQQWKLRMMAHEPALEEVADGKLLRLFAYSKSFNRTDAQVGDSVLVF